jgi:hypothetical protein
METELNVSGRGSELYGPVRSGEVWYGNYGYGYVRGGIARLFVSS